MIRPAEEKDAPVLTELTFRSKAHWGYPAHYFDIWKDELTVTESAIAAKTMYVYVDDRTGSSRGYYSLVFLAEDLVFSGGVLGCGWWLEHMFVDPNFLGKTLGTQLFAHMRGICTARCIETISILADPNARGFYEKMGCSYVGEYASTIPGRTTPCLKYQVSKEKLSSVKIKESEHE